MQVPRRHQLPRRPQDRARRATFPASADGSLPSEGVAATVIQRRHNIKEPSLARVRVTAVNKDGHSVGFAVPKLMAQAKLLEMA